MILTVRAQAAETELQPAPIRAEWIVAGAPRARSAEIARSADGMAMTAVWDCTAGAFNWQFGGDETVHILEGEVIVGEGRAARTLRAGDVAFFPAGSSARWEVPVYVKKLAFCRDPVPGPLRVLMRLVWKLRARLTTTALGLVGLIDAEPALAWI